MGSSLWGYLYHTPLSVLIMFQLLIYKTEVCKCSLTFCSDHNEVVRQVRGVLKSLSEHLPLSVRASISALTARVCAHRFRNAKNKHVVTIIRSFCFFLPFFKKRVWLCIASFCWFLIMPAIWTTK